MKNGWVRQMFSILEHFYQILSTDEANAILAASIFHYRTYSIHQAKGYLTKRAIATIVDIRSFCH